MVKHFKITDWNEDFSSVKTPNAKGISFLKSDYLIDEPIVQVFKNSIDDKFELMNKHIFIGVSSTDIMIISEIQFNGKIVIK